MSSTVEQAGYDEDYQRRKTHEYSIKAHGASWTVIPFCVTCLNLFLIIKPEVVEVQGRLGNWFEVA
jgi:hypothetical protein